jgi:hypothetical protein
MIKRALWFIGLWMYLSFLAVCLVHAQNPQTQTAPLFATNAKYTNGTAPGYWPTQQAVGARPVATGLNINVGPGTANCGSGTIIQYAGGTFALTASATNRIYLDTASSCAPAVKTSAFASTDIPLAVVVTSGSAITSIVDDRTPFGVPGSGAIVYPSAGIVKSTGSAWGSPVAFADIVALWAAGGCSSGWLKFDGTCSTPSGSVAPGSGYIFYKSGSTYNAWNRATGAVDFSGSDFGPVARSTVAASASTCGPFTWVPQPVGNAGYVINSLVQDPDTSVWYGFELPINTGTSGQYCRWPLDGIQSPVLVDQFGTVAQTTGTAVVESTTARATAGGGTIAVVYVKPNTSTTVAASLDMRNMVVRVPDNQRANESAVDAVGSLNFSCRWATTDTAIAQSSLVLPVAGNFGWKSTNSGHEEQFFEGCYSIGYDTGYTAGEHLMMIQSFALNSNHGLIYAPSSYSTTSARSKIDFGCASTQRCFDIGGSAQAHSYLDLTISFEDAPSGIWVPVYHGKEDTNGITSGTATISRSVEGTGSVSTPYTVLFDGGGGDSFNSIIGTDGSARIYASDLFNGQNSTSPVCPNGTTLSSAKSLTTVGCISPPGNIAGGALGSLPYQSASNTTTFIASPTTASHTFIPAWQPAGSGIAPFALDLGANLGTWVKGTSPIVVTQNANDVSVSCPTCGTSSATAVNNNAAATLGTSQQDGMLPYICKDSSGSGTAQSCNSATSFTVTAGNCFVYQTTTPNSGAGLTVNANSLGAKSVAIPGSSGWTTTLNGGIISANKPLTLCYDGTNLNVQQTGTVTAGGSGALTQIFQQVVSGTSTPTITIPSIPGTYSQLMLVINGRISDAVNSGFVNLTVNTDTAGADYDYNNGVIGSSGSFTSQAATFGQNVIQIAYLPGSNGAANAASSATVTIPSYANTVFDKNFISQGGIWHYDTTAGHMSWINLYGDWRPATPAAITQLVLTDAGGGHFVAGTTVTLYGVQ